MEYKNILDRTKFLKTEVLKELQTDLICEDLNGILIDFEYIESYFNELKQFVDKQREVSQC